MIIIAEGEEAVIYSTLIRFQVLQQVCYTHHLIWALTFKAYFPKYQAFTRELKVKGFRQGQRLAQFKVQIGSQRGVSSNPDFTSCGSWGKNIYSWAVEQGSEGWFPSVVVMINWDWEYGIFIIISSSYTTVQTSGGQGLDSFPLICLLCPLWTLGYLALPCHPYSF